MWKSLIPNVRENDCTNSSYTMNKKVSKFHFQLIFMIFGLKFALNLIFSVKPSEIVRISFYLQIWRFGIT